MAPGCFCSLWFSVVPQPRGSPIYPAGLGGGFCPPSCRHLFSLPVTRVLGRACFHDASHLLGFFPHVVSWRGELERGQAWDGGQGQPVPGGSWWRWVGGVGLGQPWRIPGPLGARVCPGGLTAVTREGAGCKEVPGAVGTQPLRAGASWQRLQRAQSVPGGARSFHRQRNAGLCPGPLGP